jgi:hypothetical protein
MGKVLDTVAVVVVAIVALFLVLNLLKPYIGLIVLAAIIVLGVGYVAKRTRYW